MNKLYAWVLDTIDKYVRMYYIWKLLKLKGFRGDKYNVIFNSLYKSSNSIKQYMKMKRNALMLYENDVVLNDIKKLMEKHYRNREAQLNLKHQQRCNQLESDKATLLSKITEGRNVLNGIFGRTMIKNKPTMNYSTDYLASRIKGFKFERDEE